jgi:hypothetical protein
MKSKKEYTGIIITTIFSFVVRILSNINLIEINSISYLIIVPIVSGFIPYFLKEKSFLENIFKCITYPIISTILFLTIAIVTQIEELLCFIIIGFPYIIISVVTSILLRYYLINRNKEKIHKNFITPLILLPFLTNGIENRFQKNTQNYLTTKTIIINNSQLNIWSNLKAVPNLNGHSSTSFFNIIGVPKPVKSTYDPINNIRLGYFDNGTILYEKIIEEKVGKKVSFSLDLTKSTIKKSLTLQNVIKEKSLSFHKISYELNPISTNKTLVKLSCHYQIKSNFQIYSRFLTDAIFSDFETNLLQSLKSKLDKN